MATITFRVDDEVERALSELTEDGTSRSAAIREALLSASRERRIRIQRAEAERLANDPRDRAEMRAIQEEMESLRAW
ncbi:MAG: ribbon-helix-helix protein, CopG family [Candidatus Dormibacteraeota bacterium]|nr:ribbon-helix-helix protein, CopG family [Candidatus Dormibacteraeota bacterium]